MSQKGGFDSRPFCFLVYILPTRCGVNQDKSEISGNFNNPSYNAMNCRPFCDVDGRVITVVKRKKPAVALNR